MIKYSFIKHCLGHKNSKGELAEYCIYSHETGKLLSSHKTETEAKKHLQQMHIHGGSLMKFKDIKFSALSPKDIIDISMNYITSFDTRLEELKNKIINLRNENTEENLQDILMNLGAISTKNIEFGQYLEQYATLELLHTEKNKEEHHIEPQEYKTEDVEKVRKQMEELAKTNPNVADALKRYGPKLIARENIDNLIKLAIENNELDDLLKVASLYDKIAFGETNFSTIEELSHQLADEVFSLVKSRLMDMHIDKKEYEEIIENAADKVVNKTEKWLEDINNTSTYDITRD